MSSPTKGDRAVLKRLGECLVDKKRVQVSFPFQDVVKKFKLWMDTNYARCRKTRNSTSGSIAMSGVTLSRHGASFRQYLLSRPARESTTGLYKAFPWALEPAVVLQTWGLTCCWSYAQIPLRRKDWHRRSG